MFVEGGVCLVRRVVLSSATHESYKTPAAAAERRRSLQTDGGTQEVSIADHFSCVSMSAAVTLALLFFWSVGLKEQVEGCSCAPGHPQQLFCMSDIGTSNKTQLMLFIFIAVPKCRGCCDKSIKNITLLPNLP